MRGVSICKSLLQLKCAFPTNCELFLLRNRCPALLLHRLKHMSTKSDITVDSSVVSDPLRSHRQLFKSASMEFNCVARKLPSDDAVIKFLEKHGFDKSQVRKIVKKFPSVLAYRRLDEILLPKLEFFYSKGMKHADVLKVITQQGCILGLSLENTILPRFNLIKSLIGSDDKAITIIMRQPCILLADFQSSVGQKVAVLKEKGVPDSGINYLLLYQPRTFLMKRERFTELAEKIKQTGINPLRRSFVEAIEVEASMTKTTWKSKQEAFKHWGVSEDEIFTVFKKNPKIMKVSVNKIMHVMNFLVNDMGWQPTQVFRYPEVFSMDLKQRVIPRCSTVKVLLLEGLINEISSFHKVLRSREEVFLQEFIICYREKAPHLMKLYTDTKNA